MLLLTFYKRTSPWDLSQNQPFLTVAGVEPLIDSFINSLTLTRIKITQQIRYSSCIIWRQAHTYTVRKKLISAHACNVDKQPWLSKKWDEEKFQFQHHLIEEKSCWSWRVWSGATTQCRDVISPVLGCNVSVDLNRLFLLLSCATVMSSGTESGYCTGCTVWWWHWAGWNYNRSVWLWASLQWIESFSQTTAIWAHKYCCIKLL